MTASAWDFHGGRLLKAEDIGDKTVMVTIEAWEIQDFDDGNKKLVLRFAGKEKGLGLNVGNTRACCDGFNDDDYRNWVGGLIRLTTVATTYKGQATRGLSVEVINPPAQRPTDMPVAAPPTAAPPTPPPPSIPAVDDDDDNIPF